MAKVMTAEKLAATCKDIAKNYRTLYVMGCFGAPLLGANVSRYCNNDQYNAQEHRKAMIKARANQKPPYFGFDCSGLIKAILWGWSGDSSKVYGGAAYTSDGVPDLSADQIIKKCTDVSEDFSKIQIGEAVWMPGHIGVYVGDGLAVECTPKWGNCVQITSCNVAKKGIHRRNWTKHGKIPYVEYSVETVENPSGSEQSSTSSTVDQIAREVIAGKWGNGHERREKLTAAGYDYAEVQNRVNALLK